MLKKTPPGTSKEQVERYIAKEGWPISRDSAGLLPRSVKQGGGPRVPNAVQNVLMADFGGYFIFLGTREVYGLWGFNADGHLVDIWILKENDVL